jgi:hypothetical protein
MNLTLGVCKSMICKICKKMGLRSIIKELAQCVTTLAHCEPWYDEDGRYHIHDCNTISITYQCSNGHEFITKSKPHQCWCEHDKQ